MKPASLSRAINSDYTYDKYGNLKFAERGMEDNLASRGDEAVFDWLFPQAQAAGLDTLPPGAGEPGFRPLPPREPLPPDTPGMIPGSGESVWGNFPPVANTLPAVMAAAGIPPPTSPPAGNAPSIGSQGGGEIPTPPVPMPQPRPAIAPGVPSLGASLEGPATGSPPGLPVQAGEAESAMAQAGARGDTGESASSAAKTNANTSNSLLAALRGVTAPTIPSPQRVSTPHAPQRQTIRPGGLAEVLAGLAPYALGYKPPAYPSTLGAALGGR